MPRLSPLGSFLVLAALLAPAARAQAPLPLKHAPAATHPAISASDLMTRLYIFADDSMMGRQVGTEGNLKGTAYIEREVRRMGLVPAGDSGGYFQWLPFVKRTLDSGATLVVDGQALAADQWAPLAPRGATRPIEGAPVVFGGTLGDTAKALTAEQAAGKVVVFRLPAEGGGRGLFRLLRVQPGSRLAGATAIVVPALAQFGAFGRNLRNPSFGMNEGGAQGAVPITILSTDAAAAALLGADLASAQVGQTGKTVHGVIAYTTTPAPARNVVAIVPGSDAQLRGEYVAIGAHNDHIGMGRPVDHDSLRAFNAMRERMQQANDGQRLTPAQLASIHVNVDSLHRIRPARMDSVDNGADDDGSGTVSALEIAEAFATAKQKPKRSLLFVFHTGEEAGLLGSDWYTRHPTVPLDSIVAQLNMDMVGRGDAADIPGGGPNYLELVGSKRLSTELGTIVEQQNAKRATPFVFDYQFDAPGHPENIYCRSDHAMYARFGIPVTFFTTGLHEDYHQLTDEPEYIDYQHMANIAQFVHDVAVTVANLDHRPAVDHPKPDPNAPCRQ